MRRRLVAIVALLLACCSTSAGGVAATLRIGLPNDPHALLPILSTTLVETIVGDTMFDQLLVFDDERQLQPDLATVVPAQTNGGISADGRTIVVHLRHDVRWHDGAPFTAADVVFTIHAILDPKNAVTQRSFYTGITDVRAPDPFTVRFRLVRPQSSFLIDVLGGYPMLPAHLLAQSANLATDPFNGHPIGTGPYRFVRWTRGDDIELAANPTYFRGAPKIAQLRIAIITDPNTMALALRQHTIDFAQLFEPATLDLLRHVEGLVTSVEPYNDVRGLAMNHERPILRDVTVRRAIVAAIDRVAITRTTTFGTGTPAYADLVPAMYGGRPPADFARADPAAAAAMLDRDGWKPGPDGIRVKNGVPLHLDTIMWADSPAGAGAVLAAQQMLRRVGIDTTLKSFPLALYFAPASAGGPIMSGAYDLGFFGFGGGDDTSNEALYACANRSPAGFNLERYCNPAMDRLLAAAAATYDQAKRNAIVSQIEDLAVHDATFVFMYYPQWMFAFVPTLHRVPASYDNPWYGIARWTLYAPR
jgi:peptide/nickel transport system substrate-binding protein